MGKLKVFLLKLPALLGLGLAFMPGLSSCDKPKAPEPETPLFVLARPANFPPVPAQPAHNPLTAPGLQLGRMLFYDTRLSGDNTLSCASCHLQSGAFADPGLSLSLGSGQQLTHRNSPALFNLAWQPDFFWDGGATDLESQAIGPIMAPNEMNHNFHQLVDNLQADAHYPALFQQAFGSSTINSQKVLFALAQFQRTLISSNSRYDKHVRNEPGGTLSPIELQGRALFQSKCETCHATDLFTDFRFHNNGLDSVFAADHNGLALGRGRITNLPADIGKYRTPSLRNVALTAPYMHDGRFGTLQQVLDHYAEGVKPSPTLDPLLSSGAQPGISLSGTEKEAILAFLQTLTDTEFTTNPAYSAP